MASIVSDADIQQAVHLSYAKVGQQFLVHSSACLISAESAENTPLSTSPKTVSSSLLTMSHQHEGSHDDELAPTETAGYRVGEQKTIDQLQNLDKDDEALNRWKQSLLGGANANATGATGGKATVRVEPYHMSHQRWMQG